MFETATTASRPARPAATDVGDILLFSILGSLEESDLSWLDLVRIVKDLGGREWTPTTDVILGAIERASGDGLVEVAEEDGVPRVSLTGRGRARFGDLLAGPVPACGLLGRVCLRLKSCFLDVAPPDVRRRLVDNLIGHYRDELEGIGAACGHCPKGRRLIDRWAEQERRRIRSELCWLEGLVARGAPGVEAR